MSENEVQDQFSDGFTMEMSAWSAAITFGLRSYGPTIPWKGVTRMRMPLPQFKALAILIRRAVYEYERRANTTIELPPSVLAELGIAPEDWVRGPG